MDNLNLDQGEIDTSKLSKDLIITCLRDQVAKVRKKCGEHR